MCIGSLCLLLTDCMDYFNDYHCLFSVNTFKIDVSTQITHSSDFVATHTLREESSQTNVILQYTLLAAILSVVCSVIQQS